MAMFRPKCGRGDDFSELEDRKWSPQPGPQSDFMASNRSGKTMFTVGEFLRSVGSPLTPEEAFSKIQGDPE